MEAGPGWAQPPSHAQLLDETSGPGSGSLTAAVVLIGTRNGFGQSRVHRKGRDVPGPGEWLAASQGYLRPEGGRQEPYSDLDHLERYRFKRRAGIDCLARPAIVVIEILNVGHAMHVPLCGDG